MEGAMKYAISQAEEAAFHQTGMFGSAAAKFGKFNNELESSALENGEPNAASRALGYAGNIVVPFKKTPANILATALSYSPANALRTVIFDTANLKAKRITAAKYIDEMAKSATGSSLVLLGGILAHEGIVGIDYLDDKTQSKLNSTTGNSGAVLHVGPYNISLGDFSPEAIPLIEGAVAYESKRRNGISGNTALNMFFSGLSATSDAITDTTMLSGISDVLQSIKYSDGSSDMWTRLGTSVAGNLAGQFIPSVVNVGEKTGDANKRSTYTGKSGIEGTIGSEAKYLQSRIPILGNKLEPAVDVWGNETNNFGGNAAGRLAYTGFTPATLTNNTADSVDKEISRLFLATNNKDVNPQMAQSEAKFNTEDGFKQLTPQEWTQYQKQKGTLQHQLVTDFMNTDAYKTMNDNDRADVIGKLFGYAKTSTQVKFGSKSTSAKKLDEAYAQNGSQGVIDSIIGSSQKKTEKSENDAAISELMGNNINADNLTADDLNKLNNGKGLSAKSSTGETSTGTSSASAETTATGDTSKANQYRLADLKKQMTDKETKQVLEDLKTGKVTSDTIGGLNISENAKVSAYKRAFDIEGDNNGSLKLDEVRNGIKNIKGMSDADKEKLYSEIKPDAKTDLNGNKIAEGKTASEAYGGTSNTQSTKIPDLARNATTFEKSYSGTGDPSDINTALSSSKMSRAEKDKAYSKLLDLSSLGKQESAGYGVAKSNGVSTSEYFEAREGANALAKKNTGKNNGLVSKLEANNYLASRKDLSDAEKEKLFYALVPNAKGGYTGKSTGNAAIGTVSSGSGTSSRRSSRRSSYSAPAASSSATAVQNPASVAQTAVSTPTAGTTAASAGSSASTIPGYTPGTKYNSPNITKRSTVVTLADGSTLTKEEYNSYLAKIKYRNEYATEINKILEKKGAKTGYQQLTPLPSDSQTGKKSYSSNATAASLGIGQEPSMSAVASTNGTTTSVSQTAPYISPYANDGSGIVTLSDGSKISKNEYSLYLERIKSYNSIAKKQNALLAKSNVTSGYQRLLDLPTMMQTGSKQYMSTASASMFGLAPAQTTTATSTPDINSFVQAAQTNGLDIAQLSNLASRIGDMSDAEARNYINFRTDLTPEQKNMWYKILLKPSDQSSYLVQNMLKYYYQINAKQNTSAQNMV
jgi:hypothetical protein